MHQFLFIRLDGFYTRTLLSRDKSLELKPLVIHRDKRVLDINDQASKRQIYRGMPLAEAKAILHDAILLPWEEEPYRDSQREWLDLCTEISDVIEPDEQHSAWIDLSLHPDPYPIAEKLDIRLRDCYKVTSTYGFGGSKWIAKLAAQHPDTPMPQYLKTRFLTPVDPAHRARLEYLGYAMIGEVAAVPLSVLRSQFGEAATHIRMCARGGYFEPVEAVYPPNSLSSHFAFDGAVEDSQVFDLGIQQLARELSQRLTKEDKQAKDVVVTIEHEEGRPTILKRKFTKPIQNYASALASLRLLCHSDRKDRPCRPEVEESDCSRLLLETGDASVRSLDSRQRRLLGMTGDESTQARHDNKVVAIRVRLENVTQSKRVQQELTGRNADREQGAVAAFQHVRTVFGDTAIRTGDQIVEQRRKQVLRAWKNATGWT